MKSDKKRVAIIFILIVVLGIVFGAVKRSTVEKISETSLKEPVRISHEEYVIQEVEDEEKNSILEIINETSSNEANLNVLDEKEVDKTNENVQENSYEEGKAIIIHKPDAKIKTNSILNNYKIEDTIEIGKENEDDAMSVSVISSDKHSTSELIEKLNQKDGVITVIPDFQFSTSALTEDENANLQWALQNNGQFAGTEGKDIAPITTSSENEKVIAVIDSGVDHTNEDLVNVMWKNPFNQSLLAGTCGYDFVNKDADPMDDNGHGTHCAGIIAAEANNGIGISGAVMGASNIKIMSLKAADSSGQLNLSNIISAYQYIVKAQALGVNIVAINNSWGAEFQLGTSQETAILQVRDILNDIVEQVGEDGAVSVFAAGNSGLEFDEHGIYNNGTTKYLAFPGCIENDYEITVAASDANNELAYFSNYGDIVDIAAPGVNIYSTYLKTFGPSNLIEEYSLFEDFEGETSEIVNKFEPYILTNTSTGYSLKDASSISSIEVSNENFYGDSKKSLKITIDNSSGNQNVVIRYPMGELGVTEYPIYAVSADFHVVQDTNGGGTKLSNYGFKYNGTCQISLANKLGSKQGKMYSNKIYESSNWNHVGSVFIRGSHKDIEYFDITLSNMGKGTYTLYLDNFTITKELGNDYQKVFRPYALKSGTSMAAPFVTASVAVTNNILGNNCTVRPSAKEIKDLIINNTKDNENFDGFIKYGVLNIQAILQSQEVGVVNGDANYTYDGKEHSINLNIVKPEGEVEIYYSTEQELTSLNYNTVGNTTKPTFTDVGQYEVYWYVHSNNEKYKDAFGKNNVLINPASLITDLDNEYIHRELKGEREGYDLIQLKLENNSYIYTGEEINAIGKLMFKGQELIEGKDYTVKYYLANYNNSNEPTFDIEKQPIEANATYLARISGIGNFKDGLSTEEFIIEPRELIIKAKDQKILPGHQIKNGLDEITVEGLVENQELSEYALEASIEKDSIQGAIRPSSAVIINNLNEDVTTNYNINYVDGILRIFTNEEIVTIQFNDLALYKSILGKNIETLHEDEQNKTVIFEKTIIEQVEALVLDDEYGNITDLAGLENLYNLKTFEIINNKGEINGIEKVLELPNITQVKIASTCKIEELETNYNQIYLPQFLQIIAQKQSDSTIKAYVQYTENNKSEIQVSKNENEILYVNLDNEVSVDKPAGERTIRFEVEGGIADGSKCSVLYEVEPPLTILETIQIEGKEYITLTIEDGNTVKNILTVENFPNTKYVVRATGINGNALTENDELGTGTKIEILNGEEVVETYNIAIKGDIDCDGFVDLYDILRLIELVFDMDTSYVWDETIRLAGKCAEETNSQNPDLYDILRLIEYHFDNVKF